MSVLIVGEDNPYGRDPRAALFHLPRRAAGNRLREHLGLTDVQYMRLKKVNLCPEKWSLTIAREVASQIMGDERWKVVILLGNKVKKAFEHTNCKDQLPFFGSCFFCRPVLVSLPHPSGRNLLWNEPDARQKARDLLSRICPEIFA